MRQNSKLATWLPWAGVLFVALVAILPLWGSPPYGDDIRLHVFRIPLLKAMWSEGVLFARWQPTLIFGYGSPLFNFYPPFSAYALTVLYWLVGQNAPVAVNILFALTLLLGTTGVFLLGRHLFGSAGGLLAAALYTWAPHLVFQTYARGSTANALALALFPFAAWALLRVGQRPSRRRTLIAAIFIALILLSHTAASLLFLGPLLLFGLAVVFQPKFNWQMAKPQLIAIFSALLLGLGLSAFSWLPALAEIQYTRYEIEAGKIDYQENFADIWRWPDPTIAEAHNPALPKSTGFAQIGLGLLGTGLAFFSLWQWRKKHSEFPQADWLTAVAGIIGAGTLFLAISSSGPVWELVAPLRGLQFPWRLLDIPVFFLAFAAGRLLYNTLSKWRVAAAVLSLMLAFANMVPYLYPPRIDLPIRPTLADVTAVQQQFGIYGLTAWGEYSNPTIQTWPTEPPFPGADELVPLAEKVIKAPEGLTAVSSDPWQAVWQTTLAEQQKLTLNVHDFPGWQARLDDDPLPVLVDDNGRLQLQIPAAEHKLELAFRRTPARWLADILTLGTFILLGGGLLLVWRKGDGRTSSPSQPPASSTGLLSLLIVVIFGCLLLKVVWFDRVSSPLVVHLADGRVADFTPPEDGSFDGKLQLIGSRLNDPDQLILLWQAKQGNLPPYQITLTMVDARGTAVKTIRNHTPGYTVTPNWEAGQLIRDDYALPLDLLAGPIGYELFLSVLDSQTGERLPLQNSDGQTAVPLGRVKRAPPETDVSETIGTQFGQGIKLRYAEIPAQISANEPVQLTFVWESLSPVAEDYTVFIHLLNADGTLAAGQDGQPLAGLYPTSFWERGELIVDGSDWQPNLPPGHYQLQIGLYLLETGERLPVSGPRSELGDRIILQEIEILP